MKHARWAIGLAMVLGAAWTVQPDAASVKAKATFDKAFDFKQPRTWQWTADAGQVILARVQGEDPAAVRQRAEPIIKDAVAAEMKKRGVAQATGAPDLTLTYYLIMSIGSSAHTAGQFLPTVPEWGLPMFTPSTTALQAVERGSLVLDLSSQGKVVWRGIAEAGFAMDLDMKKREAMLREAVKKVLERYPPKQ
jgi:hypothetical protein